jgi:hypothetical protein
MLKRTFRVYALSLAGGALLLGGSTVAAGAMPRTEQTTAAIVTDGAGAAKVEQVYWRHRGLGLAPPGLGLAPRLGLARRPVVLLAPLCLPRLVTRRGVPARRFGLHLEQRRLGRNGHLGDRA